VQSKIEKLVHKWYGTTNYRDSDIVMLEMICDAVGKDSRVLDVGAGTGEKFAYDLKELVAEMVGVDSNPSHETTH